MTDSLAFSFLLNSQSADKPVHGTDAQTDILLTETEAEAGGHQFGQLVSQFMSSDTVKVLRQNTAMSSSAAINHLSENTLPITADNTEDNSQSLQLLALINQAGVTDVSWKAPQAKADVIVLTDENITDKADELLSSEVSSSVTASSALKPSRVALATEDIEQHSKDKGQIIIQPVVPPEAEIKQGDSANTNVVQDKSDTQVEQVLTEKAAVSLASQTLKSSEEVLVAEVVEQQNKDKGQIIIQPVEPPIAEVKKISSDEITANITDDMSAEDDAGIKTPASLLTVTQQAASATDNTTSGNNNRTESATRQPQLSTVETKAQTSDIASDHTEPVAIQANVKHTDGEAVIVQPEKGSIESDELNRVQNPVAERSAGQADVQIPARADNEERADKQPQMVVAASREQGKTDTAISSSAARNSSDNGSVKTDTTFAEQENQQQLAGQNRAAGAEPQAATVRNDSSTFNSLIDAAQQRQQIKETATTPTVQEQLKQSLNLLQQDAAGQMRERVSLMLRQNIQVAEIRLDPADLGQMQIKINMQQEQASVQFIVQQSHAKELLEQQLPRLREMLQQQGIQLAEGQVQQQQQQTGQQTAQQQATQHGHQLQGDGDSSEIPQSATVNIKVNDRLVDYYA